MEYMESQIQSQIEGGIRNSEQADIDRRSYAKAMIDGHNHICIEIENAYGLQGYSPDIVSSCLNEAAAGRSIDQYLKEFIGY